MVICKPKPMSVQVGLAICLCVILGLLGCDAGAVDFVILGRYLYAVHVKYMMVVVVIIMKIASVFVGGWGLSWSAVPRR